MAYGYITTDGLAQLGEERLLNQLRLVTTENTSDKEAIHHTTNNLRDWLTTNGYTVRRIEVPAPGKHPHNSQMMTLLFLLETYGILGLLLSGMLVATMISAMMGQQLRQIGVMKAFGAHDANRGYLSGDGDLSGLDGTAYWHPFRVVGRTGLR